jgi:glycosyltransferase involved in cell wall biosynthesis
MAEGSTVPRPLILHVCTVPESLAFLHGQLGYMREHGFEIALVASSGPYAEVVARRERLPVHSVEMRRAITPLRDALAVIELVRLIRRLRPAIVHAHTPKGGLLGMLAAALARVPVRIYHMRGLPLETATGVRLRLLTLTERLSCALAQRVICVSHSLRAAALSRGLADASRLVVLGEGSGNGVDAANRFAPQPGDAALWETTRESLQVPFDAPVVLFLGRVVRDKGMNELALAWRTLRSRHPRAVLIIAGPEEPMDPVRTELLAELHADDRVRMLGFVLDGRPLLLAADMLVLPTYREGFPNVLLEAAAMSLPVVATSVTGCVDAVVPGETGTLVPAGDAAALAAALGSYLDSPERRRNHGEAGRMRTRRDFDPRRIWQALERLYSESLASPRG